MKYNIHEISRRISRRMLRDSYRDNLVKRAKVEYAIESIIENIRFYVLVLFIFGVAGMLPEIVICIIVLMLLRVWTGGTHMKTSSMCTIATIVFYGISIFGKAIILPDTAVIILLLVYSITCLLHAPIISPQHPSLGEIRRKRIKVRSFCGVMIVINLYLYMPSYRGMIGRESILQFADVIVAIFDYKRRGKLEK